MTDFMRKLLLYSGRHHLFVPRDGSVPRLNPLSTSSHNRAGTRTISLHEPLWLFRLRQRLFAFRGRQRCPRRDEGWQGESSERLPDTWDIGPDRNRTCSYCGSIHPDDLDVIIQKARTDARYGIEGTTKGYKVYIRQPGVRNAGEGAIKFYRQHARGTT